MTNPVTPRTDGRPLLIFDGDCGICTSLSRVARRAVLPPARGDVAAFQHVDLGPLGLTEQECIESLRFIDARGRTFAAQDAVARLLLSSAWYWRPVGALILVPGVHWLAGVAYRWVARNRHRLPGGTPACAMPAKPEVPPTRS
jgi:predicted DCC family thiol-disulfide oxidoreductase YuxK